MPRSWAKTPMERTKAKELEFKLDNIFFIPLQTGGKSSSQWLFA